MCIVVDNIYIYIGTCLSPSYRHAKKNNGTSLELRDGTHSFGQVPHVDPEGTYSPTHSHGSGVPSKALPAAHAHAFHFYVSESRV